MKAKKNYKIKLPQDIEEVELNMLRFNEIETRTAYLKLIKNTAEKYYKAYNKENDENIRLKLKVIDDELESLKDLLEEEREKYKPIGYKYDDETIQLELDCYDTIEEQLDYLKEKLNEFDLDTLNVATNVYDDIRDGIKIYIRNREHLLLTNNNNTKNTNNNEISYSEMWEKFHAEYFNADVFRQQLEKIGIEKEEEYIDYCVRRIRHRTKTEWLKYFEMRDKKSQYENLDKENLDPLSDYSNRLRVTNAKFEKSTLGLFILENLGLFEEKYFSNKKSLGDKIQTSAGNHKDLTPTFNFNFPVIKSYADKLEITDAILYLKYILKEFDREKRENFYLFLTQDDIEYLSKNFIIDDISKLNQPATLEDVGRSARISLAKENFEKNILNEINFIEEKEKINKKYDGGNKVINNISKRDDSESGNQEYLEKGTKYYLEHKHTRITLLEFYSEMKKYFGDDIGRCEKVFYKIINDIPVIRIFGYDINNVKNKMEKSENKEEITQLIEYENGKTETLLNAINDFKTEYHLKWEKRYNNNLDDDWLEEKGYVQENDSAFDKHYNGWLKYYLEATNDDLLKKILSYGFGSRNGDFDNIEEKSSVKIFLDQIEKELKNYKDEIFQVYVLKNAKLEKSSEYSEEKKVKIKIDNYQIAEEVIKCWDDGLEEFEEIYKKLSSNAVEIFGIKLTKDQIKGRYQRYASKHKDYKREKY